MGLYDDSSPPCAFCGDTLDEVGTMRSCDSCGKAYCDACDLMGVCDPDNEADLCEDCIEIPQAARKDGGE